MKLTKITGALSRSVGATRGRHGLSPCLETSENMGSLALVIVGASDYRACLTWPSEAGHGAQVEE